MFNESLECMKNAYDLYKSANSVYLYDASYNLAFTYEQLKQYDKALEFFKITKEYYKTDKTIEKKIKELQKK